MTPTTTSTINTSTKQIRVQDTFNYGSIIYNSAFGNVTAKLGNQVFHTNNQFNSNADIVIGTNNFIDINLPVSGGKIRQGSYSITYDLLIRYVADVVTPGSDTFSSVTMVTPSSQFISQIQELLTQFDSVEIEICSTELGLLGNSVITGVAGNDTITFNSVTIAQFAGVDYINIPALYTETNNYIYEDCDEIKGSINVGVNCAFAQITVQDTTKYPADAVLVREMTLRYPKKADGSEVEAPVTTNEPSITVGPYIWSGGYTIALQSTVTTTQEDDLIVIQDISVYSYPDVQCDAGLCKAAKCIETLALKYMDALKKGSRETGELFQQNFVVLLYYMRYSTAIGCQNTELAAGLLSELVAYLNFSDCGCGCGDTGSSTGNTEPTRIYPLFSNTALINGVENSITYN